MHLAELREFGEEAENLGFPAIAEGGVIVPGRLAASTSLPGQEISNGRRAEAGAERQETRSSAGSRAGSSAEATTPSSQPHAVQRRVMEHELEELKGYHPRAVTTFSSSDFGTIEIPVRLFESLPLRAKLFLEVPLSIRSMPPRPRRGYAHDADLNEIEFCFGLEGWVGSANAWCVGQQLVPDVRAWALWERGDLITSHHQNPDHSICAYMPAQGLLGMRSLLQIAGMCITWIGKVVHEQLLGFWPGPQHYGALQMRLRDRPREFCGCGKIARYAICCRPRVMATPARLLTHESLHSRLLYGWELRVQSRPVAPRDVIAAIYRRRSSAS